MAFYLSPLVDVNEIDLTTTIPAVATSIGVIALKDAYKGPEKKVAFVTDEDDLLSLFGEPWSSSTVDAYADWLSAAGFLKYGNKLYATAVRPEDARFAGVTIASSGTGNAFVAGGWGLTLDALTGAEIDTGTGGGLATVNNITDAANDHTPGTYLEVVLTGGGTGAKATVVVDGTGLVTSVTITTAGTGYHTTDASISIANATIGGAGAAATVDADTVTGYALIGVVVDVGGESYEGADTLSITSSSGGIATAHVTGVNAGAVTTIAIDTSNLFFASGDTLTVVPGADSAFPTQTIADLPSDDPDDFGDIDVSTAGDSVWAIANSRGSWGNNVRIAFLDKYKQDVLKNRRYSATGTGLVLDTTTVVNGAVTVFALDTGGTGYVVGDYVTMALGVATTSPAVVRITNVNGSGVVQASGWTIVSGGVGYAESDDNLTPLLGGPFTSDGPYSMFQGVDSVVEKTTDFLVAVSVKDQRKTTYALKDTIFNVSTSTTEMDDVGNLRFAENIINQQSNYIRISLDSSLVSEAGVTFPTALAKDTWFSFSNGSDGTWTVGEADAELTDAYDLYSNPEEIDVNMFIESGKSDTIKEHLISICQDTRKDSIAILDVPSANVINNKNSETVDLRNWVSGITSSSYAAVYGNWLEVFDKYNQKYRWIPASGYVAGIYAKTDDTNDPWWAPAGLNRAILTGVRRLAWNPKQGDRDILYSNRINPIVSFSGEGKVVWGQKTLLNKESAFNRVNVRRLFLVLEKAIATAAKYFLFEPNDPATRSLMVNMIEPFLRDVKARRGVYDFKVVCDDSNNTPERIDRNELWCNIFIKPTKTAEFIILSFVATKTGASFSEAAQAVGG